MDEHEGEIPAGRIAREDDIAEAEVEDEMRIDRERVLKLSWESQVSRCSFTKVGACPVENNGNRN